MQLNKFRLVEEGEPRCEFQELIESICNMYGQNINENFAKWAGRTGHLKLPQLRERVKYCEKTGRKPAALFTFLLKKDEDNRRAAKRNDKYSPEGTQAIRGGMGSGHIR